MAAIGVRGVPALLFLVGIICTWPGYGEPGGFRFEKETPQLRNAGCETCHGRAEPTAKPATKTIAKESLPRPIASGATVPNGLRRLDTGL